MPVVMLMAWRLGAFGRVARLQGSIVLGRAALESFGVILVVAALPHVTLGESAVILQTVPLLLVPLSAMCSIAKRSAGGAGRPS